MLGAPAQDQDQGATSVPVTRSVQKEARFCLYAEQIWSGPGTNDVLTILPEHPGDFGAIRADDWPLRDGPMPDARMVGRVHGHHIKSSTDTWVLLFNVFFTGDDRYFNGSSLAIRGLQDIGQKFEYAIVGGTGELTLAEGIVYGTVHPNASGNGAIRKMNFHVFYRPIEKPDF